MNRHTTLASSLLAATAMTFFTGLASADSGGAQDLQRVEVSGQKRGEAVRTDVRRVCPGIAAKLQDDLGGTWGRVEEPGLVRVQFRLQGGNVHGVSATSGPSIYRSAVKRAMHQLDCGNDDAADQLFAFAIEFKAPEEHSGNRTVALLMP